MATNPMHQFHVYRIGPEINVAGVDLSFTNASLFMLISAILITILLLFSTREKKLVPLEKITQHVVELLHKIQDNLFQRALDYRDLNTRTANGYGEFKEIIANEGGFIYAHWDGSKEVEEKIKKETKATIRCIPFEEEMESGKCIVTGNPSSQKVIFAISY